MDFQSAMETFAEAWVAANAGTQTQALALTRSKSPPPIKGELSTTPSPTIIHSDNDRSPSIEHPIPIRSPKITNQRHMTTDHTKTILPQSAINVNSPDTINLCNNNINNSNSNTNNNNNNNNNLTTSTTLAITNRLTTTSSSTSSSGTSSSMLPTNLVMNSKLNSSTHSFSENGSTIGSNLMHVNGPEKILPSPTHDRKDFDFSKVNAKSLPLHCIVESVTSLQSTLTTDTRSPWKRRPNIETDSYVIVPAATPFCDIVNTALQRLGYSQDIANTARGSIVIKNWKPLPLEKIADSPLVCVGDILGELTSVVTLKICVLRAKPSSLTEIKDKLLKLLILQSHTVLRSTGCPLDEITLSQICRNPLQNTFPFSPEISDELRRKFDQWWANQLNPQTSAITPKMMPFVNQQPSDIDFCPPHHLHQSNRDSLIDNHHPSHHNMIVHPALQTVHTQYPSQKTRMRTSFDPEMELPKLQRWFQENPHPSRQQIQSYVIQLNSLESRRGRKPLDVNNVVYWFKNARAAQKRAEMRSQGIGNGYVNSSGSLLLNQSDYMKSPHSVKSEDIDNLSQHSDDLDDELDRQASPQLPLSLTTHERNRTSSSENKSSINICSSPSPSKISISNNNNNINNNNGVDHQSSEEHSNPNSLLSSNLMNPRSDSPKTSPKSEDLDMDESDGGNQLDGYRSPSPDSRRELPFPMVSNSMFSHSIMYMSHYMPAAMAHHQSPSNTSPVGLGPSALNMTSMSSEERRKRNRTFIDPVTEVPKLEQWFAMNTHPSHNLILKYTEDLNRMPYRQKFPRLESKNVQFWFKNRRAKCKRLKMSLYDTTQLSGLNSFQHSERD